MPLNELFWDQVRKTLANQGRDEDYIRQTVPRNKNTYTNWFLRNRLSRIKDLEDIAEALGVPPSELVSTNGQQLDNLNQLRLPFDPHSKLTLVEIEIDE